MGHYYLRINPEVKQFLSKDLPEAGWVELIVSDLTEAGTRLSAVHLPSTEHGPQLALYGDQFYARASTDKYRADSLWVYRVELARNPNQVPVTIDGRFEPLTDDRRQSVRDSVTPLFKQEEEPATVEAGRVMRLKPSPRLAKMLAGFPSSARAAWRPLPTAPASPSVTELLRILRSVWSRYRLDRFASPTPREEWLLRGSLKTDTLTNEERLALLALVDIGTLSSLAASSGMNRDALEDFLRRLAELVPPSDVRAAIWGAMLAGASDVDLRDELRSAAVGLRAVVNTGTAERAWTRAALDGLGAAAARGGDKAVVDLLQSVEGDTHPLLGVAIWAERLETATVPALPSVAPPPAVPDEPSIAPPRLENGADAPDEEAGSSGGSLDPAVAQWALAKCVSELEPFVAGLGRITAAASTFAPVVRFETPEELLGALSRLEALAAEVKECLEQLPPRPQLEVDLGHAMTVHDGAKAALGAEFDPGVPPFDELSLAELDELVDLVQKEALDAIPVWAWSVGEGLVAEHSDVASRAARLADPAVRRLVGQLVVVREDYSDLASSAVSKISPPPVHVAPDEHMRLEMEQLRLAARRLHRVPEEHREWVQLALARGDDEEDTLQLLDRFGALSERLPPDTARSIREEVLTFEEPLNREKRLHQYELAVKFFEDSLGGAQDVTFGQLTKRVERTHEAPALTPTPSFELSVDHNWVGTAKARAPIVFVPHEDPNRPYGFVSIPVAVEALRRWDYHIKLDVRVRSRQRGHSWLQEWDRHTPETLDIGRQDWRKTIDGRFVFTFELRMAIRRPEKANEAFEVALNLIDAASAAALAPERVLRWESIELPFEPLTFEWPVGIHPDYVRAHPIGPQKRLNRIEARIKGGTSFAVLAPRRFGKTTLVEYLKARATELKVACPDPIVCTSLTDDRGIIDLPLVWRTVAEGLQTALQCTVSADLRNDLPGPHAFDRARTAAAEAGWKGILVLFDESQLLFSGSTGPRLGDRLKDLLERSWMSNTAVGMVPLLFGFVGLPSFASSIGVNFRNLLEPDEGWDMDDDDVNRIILAVTKNKLHTTREARHHLAQAAPNLYLARILVESLRDRANRLQRSWVNYDDVAAVQADLARQLEQGRQGNIASLIRDSLNDSPDVNRWQPSPSYPMAMALALSRHDGIRGAQPLAVHARQLLNGWCDDQQFGTGKPHYREDDVRRHLDRLSELGVFDRSDFKSRFVEAWLVGEAREGVPPSATNALIKGASTIVSVAELLEPVESAGGQARIFRFTRDGVQYALRKAALTSETERNRFLETVATLKVLSSGIPRGEAGIQYIFDLDAVGFSEQDDMVGVHVYRWIEGQDLQSKVSQLPGALVAEIGLKLGIALQLLHRFRITHRDIRPKNVVLARDSKDPVLIDFGLARFNSGQSLTYLDNEFSAPEVSRAGPQWTPAADVYGLGRTLQVLLRSGDATGGGLQDLLNRMVSEKPDERPQASELPSAFDAVRARHLVDDQCRPVLQRIDAAVAIDAQRRWYPPVVEKFKPTFRMLVMGLHSDVFDRCAELADFLNQIVEAYPARRGGAQLTLGSIKHRNDETGDKFCLRSIDALHRLRLSLSHGGASTSKSNLMRKLEQPNDDELRAWVREGSDVIADHFGVDSLRTIVAQVL